MSDNYTPVNPSPTPIPCDGEPYALTTTGQVHCLTDNHALPATGGTIDPVVALVAAIIIFTGALFILLKTKRHTD